MQHFITILSTLIAFTSAVSLAPTGTLGQPCNKGIQSLCAPGLVPFHARKLFPYRDLCYCVLDYVNRSTGECTLSPLKSTVNYKHCLPGDVCVKSTLKGEEGLIKCEYAGTPVYVAKMGERCQGLGLNLDCERGLTCVYDTISIAYRGYCVKA